MKVQHALLSFFLLLLLLAGGAARADQVFYDASGFVSGQQSFVESLNLTGPGMLTVTLSNVSWPEQLASLNLVVGTSHGLMGSEMGAGTETFAVGQGGMVYTQWFGTAQGPLDLGVYSLKISFSAMDSGGTAVPLPPGLLLLASGLILMLWQLRQRRRNGFRHASQS